MAIVQLFVIRRFSSRNHRDECDKKNHNEWMHIHHYDCIPRIAVDEHRSSVSYVLPNKITRTAATILTRNYITSTAEAILTGIVLEIIHSWQLRANVLFGISVFILWRSCKFIWPVDFIVYGCNMFYNETWELGKILSLLVQVDIHNVYFINHIYRER